MPFKPEAPIVVGSHKSPPTPPARTATNVVASENQTHQIIVNESTTFVTSKKETDGRTATTTTESKIPTKISPPKDLNLKSKANPSTSVAPSKFEDVTPSPPSSTSSPTKKPIGTVRN